MERSETIERIKARYDKWALDNEDMKAIQALIPELKESEDERIRKAIEGTIRVYGKTQGEWLCGYDMDTLVIHLREAFGALERQKEQKPAEWSEKDNAAHIRILGAVGKAFMGVLPTKPSEEDVHWLKTLPERFNLQPKQEQSEEDKERVRQNGRLDVCYNPEKYGLCHKVEWGEEEMEMLVSIIHDYEMTAKSFCGNDGKIMFLKAIRDGEYGLSKQEWSEEDEQTFIKSVETLEYLGKFELANWLKDHKPQFLKPQNTWKPSEEEIGALAEAMERNDKIGYLLHQLHEELKHNYKL